MATALPRVAALLLPFLLLTATSRPVLSQRGLTVFTSQRSQFVVPTRNAAVGIEFLNHEIYGGLYAQMVFGESFEEAALSDEPRLRYAPPPSDVGIESCAARLSPPYPEVSKMWLPITDPGAFAHFSLDTVGDDAAHGEQFQSVTHIAGKGAVGVANYGLNCQHGMTIQEGKPYDGFSYVRSSSALLLSISLHDWVEDVTLASISVELQPASNWTRVPLRFVANRSTTCGAMTASTAWGIRSDLASCSGRLTITHDTPGATLDIDLTFLAPGAWGLEPAPWAGTLGLPARRDVADALKRQHLGVLRMGGTMCNVEGYRWKFFRGPREERQPYSGYWYEEKGMTQTRGFGMFEVVDLCTAIRCVPIITLNALESPEDMADFVEYSWGNSSTKWGALRIADGHPQPYRVHTVEIGNEVDRLGDLCPSLLVPIVHAMDQRSIEIGAPLFEFVIGYNVWPEDVAESTARRVALDSCIESTRFLGERIFMDFHTEAFAEAAAGWGGVLDSFGAVVEMHNSTMRVMVLETNAWPASPFDHGLARGIGHGAFSNMAQRRAALVTVLGYANALQHWQGMDVEQQFPQGQLFVLGNTTFGQAAYHAITMISESWQPRVLATNERWQGTDGVDALAVGSEDGRTVVVRLANWNTAMNITLDLDPPPDGDHAVHLRVLRGRTEEPGEENTPAEPNRVTTHDADVPAYSPGMVIQLPQLSFAVITIAPPSPLFRDADDTELGAAEFA